MGMTFVLIIWGYVGWMPIYPDASHESKCFGEGQQTVIAFNLTGPKETLTVKDKTTTFMVPVVPGAATTFCAPKWSLYSLTPKAAK